MFKKLFVFALLVAFCLSIEKTKPMVPIFVYRSPEDTKPSKVMTSNNCWLNQTSWRLRRLLVRTTNRPMEPRWERSLRLKPRLWKESTTRSLSRPPVDQFRSLSGQNHGRTLFRWQESTRTSRPSMLTLQASKTDETDSIHPDLFAFYSLF